ncbi:phenylalanine--tRNA ligase subunit beta [Sandarakinorhabdus sp.]|uniref:phenylalanine--tRNA ligase subunit beta n=1 Tax=Sandarakinorhabdus sp. TaxID=1916663 RepID=UPI003342AF13
MKFTLSWLKDHLETSASVADIADALTRCGLEVEGIENPADALGAFTIAHVISAARHPQADKLQVLTVDTGAGAPVQVVCGAPNARAGMKGVFGAPGTYVPGSGLTLKIAAIRGVESAGMMCSMRELELSDEHDGIISLPGDAPVGARFVDWAGLNDPVFDIAITPNRQECLGVMGIARDLAAAGIGTLKPRDIPPVAGSFAMPRPIRIEDAEGCPAFAARVVRGVRNGLSPDWLQRRLRAVGLRPISALVDITNFLSIDAGRPLHVYDVAKLNGGLTARRARAGETMLALNGKTYALDDSMTVIADDREVHDIAGIMGGEHSGCSDSTTDVLIESAYFTPERIGTTGRALGINSDARARFERGVDPMFVVPGLEFATQMVIDLCGGEASDLVVAGAIPDTARSIAYRPARVLGLAGLDVAEDEQADILSRLGFGVTRCEPWQVAVPPWRRDVDGEADLVEEVVRIHGLDRVPATPLPRNAGVAVPTATPLQRSQRRLRRVLAGRGLDEAITWSFLPPADTDAFGGAAFTLTNPISADMAAMRTSLLPGLLSAAARTMARGTASVRLFELGQRYLADGEHPSAALLLAGEARARDWRNGPAIRPDAYDAKAEALAALAALGAPVQRLTVAAPADNWWHPGRAGRLLLGKVVLADFGIIHPRVSAGFDVKGAVAAVELYLDALPPRSRKREPWAPSPLLPLTRDFAFVVGDAVPADSLLRAVASADKSLITAVKMFDRYTGPGVEPGKLSLAVEVTLQPTTTTLTDADIDAVSAKVVAAAAKLGAVLRG